MADGQIMDSLTTIGVLLALFILAYCKFTNKTLADIFNEIKEMFSSQTEEVSVDFT